jgi:SAM-dependent methyltransferase
MSDRPRRWISPRAELFAEHFVRKHPAPEPGEIEYLLRRIAEGGEPVLELGCGTGRVLIPLLERSVDVVGIDVSPPMLARCRAMCEERGLAPDLREQAMQSLDLGRRFGTVFLGSGGLGVLTSRVDVEETLRRVFEHLRPGGAVSLELETPPGSEASERDGVWLGEWDAAEDGSVLAIRSIRKHDPSTGIRDSVMIFELYVDGALEGVEQHDTSMRFWDVDVIETLLTEAGFVEVRTTRVFSDEAPPAEGGWLVVRARRAAEDGLAGVQ